MIRCTKCQQDKPESAFWRSMLEVKTYQCKTCRGRYIRMWKDRNVNKQPGYVSTYHAKLKREFVDAYGGKCACCGERELGFLSLDHVNGGGRKHRLALSGNAGGGTTKLLCWLRQQGWPTGYQVLCYNCNLAKGFLGRCPHQGW